MSDAVIANIRDYLVCFVNDTATTEIYTYGHTLSLHDALPIYVEHRDGDDETEIEPVGDIDMRFAPLDDRADEDDEIDDPDDRQPQVDIPFGLGIFARFGDAHDVSGRGEHQEELITPEDRKSTRLNSSH